MNSNKIKQIITALLLLTVTPNLLFSKTYQIVEQDMVEEMMAKKPQFMKNATAYAKKAKDDAENMMGRETVKAKRTYTYYVDPTFTLDRDIPKYNRYGVYEGILYKKGTQVNPVQFTKVIPPDMVVFNPCDKEEKALMEKLRKTRYKDKHFLIVSTMCTAKNLMKDNLGKQAFMLTKEVQDKFKIKETVSIISVDKTTNKIKVEVFNAKETK